MLTLCTIIVIIFLPSISAHGRLIDPPSRASAWRYGFDTPHNYNDHELYCGGFTRQWVKNEGKCGVCGDAWDTKTPRAHEFGGTYGQGLIVRKYPVGGTINIRVELTANHFGYFTFSICPDYKTASQRCLDKHILKLVKPQEGVDHEGVRYFPQDGNKVYEMKYRLPAKKACDHCILQWRYIAGNNWGNCPNGTGAVGCGPQEEFRACADITIAGKGAEPMVPEVETETEGATTTLATPPQWEESYSPVTAFVISIVSFLVVCLVLAILYFHFYQVGRRVKAWLKGKGEERAPTPPPRMKRGRGGGEEGMKEVELKAESAA